MNEDTLVAVCCYAGDRHQVINALPQYLHHQCPVVVFSPEDRPADVQGFGVEQRIIGRAGYVGQVSLDRQRLHLETLLQYPQKYFLLHDSDSLCLSAEIPAYLYAEPDVFWSNVVPDDYSGVTMGPYCESALPEVAFQPPYFFSRGSVEKLVAASGKVVAQPARAFIDHYMLQLTIKAGLCYRGFPDGRSFPAWKHLTTHTPVHAEVDGAALMADAARAGVTMVHAVKHPAVVELLMRAHQDYLSHE